MRRRKRGGRRSISGRRLWFSLTLDLFADNAPFRLLCTRPFAPSPHCTLPARARGPVTRGNPTSAAVSLAETFSGKLHPDRYARRRPKRFDLWDFRRGTAAALRRPSPVSPPLVSSPDRSYPLHFRSFSFSLRAFLPFSLSLFPPYPAAMMRVLCAHTGWLSVANPDEFTPWWRGNSRKFYWKEIFFGKFYEYVAERDRLGRNESTAEDKNGFICSRIGPPGYRAIPSKPSSRCKYFLNFIIYTLLQCSPLEKH